MVLWCSFDLFLSDYFRLPNTPNMKRWRSSGGGDGRMSISGLGVNITVSLIKMLPSSTLWQAVARPSWHTSLFVVRTSFSDWSVKGSPLSDSVWNLFARRRGSIQDGWLLMKVSLTVLDLRYISPESWANLEHAQKAVYNLSLDDQPYWSQVNILEVQLL